MFFETGDSGFTLDGLAVDGGTIRNGANHITIRNSDFTNSLWITGVRNGAILLDHNTHNNLNSAQTGDSARIFLPYGGANSGVTVRNSLFQGGDMDGIEGGVGLDILNNRFINLCYVGQNHTDAIQFYGNSVGATIRGNYVYAGSSCGTQGIATFDHGTEDALLEDNVVDIRRPWGIEWYSDVNSVIRHNTVVYYPASQCHFNTPCGRISVTAKTEDPIGTGTQVYDNLANLDIGRVNPGRIDHNVSGQNAVFVGPTPLDAYADYYLAAGSVGKGAASDGLDVGIR